MTLSQTSYLHANLERDWCFWQKKKSIRHFKETKVNIDIVGLIKIMPFPIVFKK
jgi:hypothetical protein